MNKRLGQHIIVNKSAVKKIIDALELGADDAVIEIGPGTGALTRELLKTGAKIVAIEKDKNMARRLSDELGTARRENMEIIEGDALEQLPIIANNPEFSAQDYKLVGNIPYYITGRLFRVLSEMENRPQVIVLTLQKEVAERITAKPPRMNLLGAITQFWAEAEIIKYLKPEDFLPPPEVESAIIKLMPRDLDETHLARGKDSAKDYFNFLKFIFKQPRKTVLNNLSAGLNMDKKTIAESLRKSGIRENERPQNITNDQLKDIFKDLCRPSR